MATEEKVKKDDLVVIIGTGASRFLPKGKEQTVHKILADKFVKQGNATVKGSAPKTAKKK